MRTELEKKAIALKLLPFLNKLANENKEAIRFVAEKKEEITFSELMLLSDDELDKLDAFVKSAKAAKQTQKQTKRYDGLVKPEVSSVTDRPKHTFIC
jgi:hypothetical protein